MTIVPLDVDEVENEIVSIIETFGQGMSREDARALFHLIKERAERFWEDYENRQFEKQPEVS